MIDPSTVGKLFEIAQKIYDQLQKAGKLKPLANDLAYRIEVIQMHIGKLKNLEDTTRLDDSIKRLDGILTDCLNYATKIAGMSDILKFIKAGGLIEKHDELLGQLDSIINDMSFAVDTFILTNQVEAEHARTQYQAGLAIHRTQFEAALQADLMELQMTAADILSQGEASLTKLGALEVNFNEIKAKLDILHESAHQQHANIPPNIKVTVLAAGANADTVVNETMIGVGMGKMTIPENASRSTIDMAKELAVFSLDQTKAAHDSAPPPSIEVTVLETNAYARLVTQRTQKAQPGELTITPRSEGSSTTPSQSSAPLASNTKQTGEGLAGGPP